MSAREFFDKYLIPNVREWEGEPLYERRAMNAVLSLNHMADWFFLQSKDEAKLPMSVTGTKQYREHLVSAECPDFQIIWDVADAHKHFKLDRKSAKVKQAVQTTVGSLGWGQGGYGAGVFGGGPQIVVDFSNNKKRALSTPVQNVVKMWARLLLEKGW